MREEGFFVGSVMGYFVIVGTGDTVSVFADQMRPRTREQVKGLNHFIKKAKALRLGWGQFQDDGDEVIYLYDKGDGNFGYAVSLDDPQCSEWGYAPFEISAPSAVLHGHGGGVPTHPPAAARQVLSKGRTGRGVL